MFKSFLYIIHYRWCFFKLYWKVCLLSLWNGIIIQVKVTNIVSCNKILDYFLFLLDINIQEISDDILFISLSFSILLSYSLFYFQDN